jgi:glycosyltransferase involved in cell wall biosynthesis
MRCGTPVLAGDRTSLPEVVGDAGLTFDPYDAGAVSAALTRLISDPALRGDLREKGLRRAREFDWRATARATLQVYKSATGE